jgi:putative FmdB family regulatory protein
VPLLKYKCKKCEKVFEELVFGEEAVTCPECGSEALRHYQGKCYFGSGSSSSGCSKASCSGCSGCK